MSELRIVRSFVIPVNGQDTELTIEPTTLEGISEFRSQAASEKIRFTPKTEMFVLRDDQKQIYGFCGIDFQGSRAVFKNAYIRPEYRGNGLWQTMFEYRRVVASMRKGIKAIEATCTDMSINLYLRLGAQVITQYKELTKVRIPL